MFNDKVLSIDIGTYYTKLALGEWSGKKLTVEKTMNLLTPKDIYLDGHIIDFKGMVEFLGAVIKEHSLKKSEVVFTIDSTEIIMREMVLPWAAEKDLRSMLSFEIEKHFPVKSYDYVSEFQVVEEIEKEGVKSLRVEVVVIPKLIVDKYWELAHELKLRPIALEFQPASVSKIFSLYSQKYGMEDYNKSIALIDGGHSKIRISIINEGKLEFSKAFLKGAKEIDEALSMVLDLDTFNIEEIKKKGSLIEQEELKDLDLVNVNRVIRDKVDEWMMEIQPNIRYYLGLKDGNRIDRMLICGGLSEIEGIPRYIEDIFNRPVEILSDPEFVEKKNGMDISNNYLINLFGSLIKE